MGEFPEPAIHGDPIPTTWSPPAAWSSLSTTSDSSINNSSFQSSTTKAEPTSTTEPPSETYVAPESTPWSPIPKPPSPSIIAPPKSASPSSTVQLVTSSIQSASSVVPTTVVIISTGTLLPPTPSSTQHSTSSSRATTQSTTSLPATSTRPIFTPTPTPTYTPDAPIELVSSGSRLSLGGIIGVVAAITIVLGVFAFCLVMGPRKALDKAGIYYDHKEPEGWSSDDEEKSGDEGGTVRRISSDWWNLRTPGGTFGTRVSGISTSGPGIAGVGAGGRTVQDTVVENDLRPQWQEPVQRDQGMISPSRRATVRSGWFATSMVRGASLLSLGSMLKPEPVTSPISREGSAGRRFQELYRRERASEMGERIHSTAGQYIPTRSTRAPYPAGKRPSRLSTIPDVLVQDATLTSLSSASRVTGRGYDADVERV
ncbi:hypothetical protein RhiJN_27857 [Ceratobasidium sp. AG-Ba]|nr:hypothetical protein RhiJN_27857 [Ceratobasidium sp. AG-Ba]